MEVFGTVMTAIELIQMAKSNLERAKRVGKTVKTLRFTLNRLMELEDDVNPYRDQDLLAEIKELVEEATELIQDNRNPRRQAMAFFWTTTVDADVQRINSSLTVIYASLNRRIEYVQYQKYVSACRHRCFSHPANNSHSRARHGSIGAGGMSPQLLPVQSLPTSDTNLLEGLEPSSPRLQPQRISTGRLEPTAITPATSVPCTLYVISPSFDILPYMV